MGYYTDYKLEIIETDNYDVDYYKEIGEISEYGRIDEDSIKWYDHEEHMKELSNKYPNTLFKLEGEGEEQGDSWVKYFKGGKMQVCRAKIAFDPFDESKLS